MWQMIEALSKAANVSPLRLNIFKLESSANMPGMRAHLAIYTSPATGSGIPGIDPVSSRDIAEDLIAQVKRDFIPFADASCRCKFHCRLVCLLCWKQSFGGNVSFHLLCSPCLHVQGSDPRSRLRAMRPSVTKVEYEGEPSIQAAPVQAGPVESDLMRNFMSELETLTFFIQANHDDNLLYHYSRVVWRIRPLTVLNVKPDAAQACIGTHFMRTNFFACMFLTLTCGPWVCVGSRGCRETR